MTNESFSVRPRMNASGAISTVPRSSSALDPLDVHHVVQRVVERAQVRIDLLLQVAGQEAELLARLDGRARQDDPADLLREQERDGLRHRQVRLAGAGGPDAEHDVVLIDGVEIPALVERSSARSAGACRPASRCPSRDSHADRPAGPAPTSCAAVFTSPFDSR